MLARLLSQGVVAETSFVGQVRRASYRVYSFSSSNFQFVTTLDAFSSFERTYVEQLVLENHFY